MSESELCHNINKCTMKYPAHKLPLAQIREIFMSQNFPVLNVQYLYKIINEWYRQLEYVPVVYGG